MAEALTEDCLPFSAKKAGQIGFVDRVLDKQHSIFTAQVKNLAHQYVNDPSTFAHRLAKKTQSRYTDELAKPLSAYRQYELIRIRHNFFGDDDYHNVRKGFVFKSGNIKNRSQHRQSSANRMRETTKATVRQFRPFRLARSLPARRSNNRS